MTARALVRRALALSIAVAGGLFFAAPPALAAPMPVSAPHMLHHAYGEALHAHEAVATGMTAMARNHAANVDLALGMIDAEKAIADPTARGLIEGIRTQARELAASQDATRSEALVGQFIALFAAMPELKAGGGGGMTGRARAALAEAPIDHMAMASASFADAQADAAIANYDGAMLHVRHGIMAIDRAGAAAKNAARAELLPELTAMRYQAELAARAVEGRGAQAVQATGAMVAMLGHALPRFTTPMAGGGGGEPAPKPAAEQQPKGPDQPVDAQPVAPAPEQAPAAAPVPKADPAPKRNGTGPDLIPLTR